MDQYDQWIQEFYAQLTAGLRLAYAFVWVIESLDAVAHLAQAFRFARSTPGLLNKLDDVLTLRGSYSIDLGQ
jgi:hypothetical protein